MTSNVIHPSVIWAQRKNCVFLTICLDDCKDPEVKYEGATVSFKGKGGPDQREHEAVLELFGNISSEASAHIVKPRNIEICLKKEEEKFWPRLTKSQGKIPWIKIDFNKWKDEDDSEDENGGGGGGGGGMGGMGGMPGMGGMGGGGDFEEMMRQMGGLGGGMPGGGKPSLDDLDNHETDSDDEEEALPDLE